MRGRFVRFALIGGLAAMVNLTSRCLLNLLMSFTVAVPVAYLLGMVTAYGLCRWFVFEGSGRSIADELWRFTMVNMVAAAQVWIISVGLGLYLFPRWGFKWHPLDVAHLIGVAVPALTSYLGHRRFSFAPAVR